MSEHLIILPRTTDYVITVIEDDEAVALAGNIPGTVSSTPLFTATLVTMAVLTLVVIAVFYFIQCRRIQLRIQDLMKITSTRKGQYNCWNIRQLKEECARLEYLASDQLINDTITIPVM